MHNPDLSNLVAVLVLGLSMGVGSLAAALLFCVLRPQSVRRGSETVRTSPGRCWLVGLLTTLVCTGGFVLCKAMHRFGALPGVALALALAYGMLSGWAMVAHCVGERVQTALMAKSLGSDAMAVIYGAVPLLAVGFLPVVGQFIQLVAGLVGLGAAVSTWLVKSKPPAVQT
jgi:hypothetical protein